MDEGRSDLILACACFGVTGHEDQAFPSVSLTASTPVFILVCPPEIVVDKDSIHSFYQVRRS